MNDLLRSIHTVIDTFNIYLYSRYEEDRHIGQRKSDFIDLVGSIELVKEAYYEYNEDHTNKRIVDLNKAIESICKISSSVLQKLCGYESIPSINAKPSILSQIGKQYNENLHSDFIAALFDPQIMGDFARKFFVHLIQYQHSLKNTKILTGRLIPHREIRLDAVYPEIEELDLGSRRIDVLVEAPNHVLLIENKVFTFESTNQTVDYYRCAKSGYPSKEVVAFFLSPSGMPAFSSKFIAINYFDIYRLITELENFCSPVKEGRSLLDFYIKELENTILSSQIKAIQFSSAYLKEKGYGI